MKPDKKWAPANEEAIKKLTAADVKRGDKLEIILRAGVHFEKEGKEFTTIARFFPNGHMSAKPGEHNSGYVVRIDRENITLAQGWDSVEKRPDIRTSCIEIYGGAMHSYRIIPPGEMTEL